MRKTFCFILTMALLVVGCLGTTAFAAPADTQETATSRASQAVAIEFSPGHSGSARLIDIGAYPTISVTLGGNPRMNFKVTVTCPSGVYMISQSTPANGSTVSKKIWTDRRYDTYIVEVSPVGGVSAGETYSGTAVANW